MTAQNTTPWAPGVAWNWASLEAVEEEEVGEWCPGRLPVMQGIMASVEWPEPQVKNKFGFQSFSGSNKSMAVVVIDHNFVFWVLRVLSGSNCFMV